MVGSYAKVLILQALLTGCFAAPLAFLEGGTAALSALLGGGIALAGGLMYVGVALLASESAAAVLMAHLAGEFAKVLVIAALLAVVLFAVKWVMVGWLLISLAVALAGYWIALLIV